MNRKCAKSVALQMGLLMGFPLLSSGCILFVPIVYGNIAQTILCASVFWICLLAFFILLAIVHYKRRKGKKNIKGRMGIISFFQNKPAKIMDILLCISILALLASLKIEVMQNVIQYVLSFLVLFSFQMHCTLNGKNYRYLQFQLKSPEYQNKVK